MVSTKAKSNAIADWNAATASILHPGDLTSDTPGIDASGLYLTVSWEDASYIREHNSVIRGLIETQGLPSWAPGCRRVDEHSLPAIVEQAKPLAEFVARSKKQGWLIRTTARIWEGEHGARPTSFLRLEDREIVLLIGKKGECIVVEALDVRFNVAMETYKVCA